MSLDQLISSMFVVNLHLSTYSLKKIFFDFDWLQWAR